MLMLMMIMMIMAILIIMTMMMVILLYDYYIIIRGYWGVWYGFIAITRLLGCLRLPRLLMLSRLLKLFRFETNSNIMLYIEVSQKPKFGFLRNSIARQAQA